MSMPQYFAIAVITDRQERGGEFASLIVAALRGREGMEIVPKFIPTSSFSNNDVDLAQIRKVHGLKLIEPVTTDSIDAKSIDLWLALDKEGEKSALQKIQQQGAPPSSFYRTIFPNPVLGCEFVIPDLTPNTFANSENIVGFGSANLKFAVLWRGYWTPKAIFRNWFVKVEGLFDPLRQRIWGAFYESS